MSLMILSPFSIGSPPTGPVLGPDTVYIIAGNATINNFDKFNFTTTSVTSEPVIGVSETAGIQRGGVGNGAHGVYITAGTGAGTYEGDKLKWEYATDVITVTDISTWTDPVPGATGDGTYGYFVGQQKYIKHTFSSGVDNIVTGQSSLLSLFERSGTGNGTIGIIAGGDDGTFIHSERFKIVFASETWTVTTPIQSGNKRGGAAFSNLTRAIETGGETTWTAVEDYKYADETTAILTNLSTTRFYHCAGEDGTSGMIAGSDGVSTPTYGVELFNFSSNTFTVSTALSTTNARYGATSGAAAGLI